MRLLIDIGNTHTTLGVWINSKLLSVITDETKNFSQALLNQKLYLMNYLIYLYLVQIKLLLSKTLIDFHLKQKKN